MQTSRTERLAPNIVTSHTAQNPRNPDFEISWSQLCPLLRYRTIWVPTWFLDRFCIGFFTRHLLHGQKRWYTCTNFILWFNEGIRQTSFRLYPPAPAIFQCVPSSIASLASKLSVWSQTVSTHRYCVQPSPTHYFRCSPRLIIWPLPFAASVGEFALDNDVSHLIKYADDFIICSSLFKNSHNLHVQEAHNQLMQWTSDTSLTANLKKCKCLVISSSLTCVDG